MAAMHKRLSAWVSSGTPAVAKFQQLCGVTESGPTNPVLHVLFTFGAATGNELFFITFLPWLFWEFDWEVARRITWLWSSSYYIGQFLKDILQLPRPPPARVLEASGLSGLSLASAGSGASGPRAGEVHSSKGGHSSGGKSSSPAPSSASSVTATPPTPSFPSHTGVIRLERHYETEYGMPSTHAMNAVAMPGALAWVTLSSGRWDGNTQYLLGACALWFSLCTLSRLYMGVHSPADIVTGLILGAACLGLHVGAGNALDTWVLLSRYASLILPTVVAVAMYVYPRPAPPLWVSTPGDTAIVLGAGMGVAMGCAAYGGYHVQAMGQGMQFGELPWSQWRGMLPRTLLGFAVLVLTRAIVKTTATGIMTWVVGPEGADSKGGKGKNGGHGGRKPSGSEVAQELLVPTPLARAVAASGPTSTNADSKAAESLRRRAHVQLSYEGDGSSKQQEGGKEGQAQLRIRAPSNPREDGDDSPALAAIASDQSEADASVRPGTSKRYAIELPVKLATYGAVGWNALVTVPILLQALGMRQYGLPTPDWLIHAVHGQWAQAAQAVAQGLEAYTGQV